MSSNEKLKLMCKNVKDIYSSAEEDRLSLEEVTKLTVIVGRSTFNCQEHDPTGNVRQIYYIRKYQKLLTFDQTVDFLNSKTEEKFLLIQDGDADVHKVWAYFENMPNVIKVHLFHLFKENTLTKIGYFQNKPRELKWEKPVYYPEEGVRTIDFEERRYSSQGENLAIYFDPTETGLSAYSAQQTSFLLINTGYSYNSSNIMTDFLKIVGITRITREKHSWRGFYTYKVGINPELEDKSIPERYGMPFQRAENDYGMQWGGEYMIRTNQTVVPVVSEEDKKRIYDRINTILDNKSKDDSLGFYTHAVLLISEPYPGHRRPTFHYFQGFRTNNITEIVELFTGDLLMKDMTPENVYTLCSNGVYCLTTYKMYAEAKDKIVKDVEYDLESLSKWTETKSLNPTLIKTLTEGYFDNIDVNLIGQFNRLPFGVLLAEQLIKTGYSKLAINLVNYINTYAYKFNTVCNKLSDLFPGADETGTSIAKILNLSKPALDFLLQGSETVAINDMANNLFTRYKMLVHFDGTRVLSNIVLNKIQNYLKLIDERTNIFALNYGNRTFDFIDHPDLTKIVVRMLNKIDNSTLYGKDNIKRQYKEIVKIYVSFLDYQTLAPEEEKAQWNPESQNIFIEFSLTGNGSTPLDPVEEMATRERHANMAFATYKDMANAEVKKQNEAKYYYRKLHALKNLETSATFEKTDKTFGDKYCVIAPSSIYGRTTIASVEKEGEDMNHCVFRMYATPVATGDYTVLYLRKKNRADESYITIGITSRGQINQTYARNDTAISREDAALIVAWAKSKKGKVWFSNESGDPTRPGGWPSTVNVPELEKPDAIWLNKLAKTC